MLIRDSKSLGEFVMMGNDFAILSHLNAAKRVAKFLKQEDKYLCIGSNYCYEQLCKGWSLDGLGNIKKVKESMIQITKWFFIVLMFNLYKTCYR